MAFFLKRHFRRHACFYTKVGEKITGGWCLHSRIRFTRAHLVLTNLLTTSLLVLCFSQWFLLFLPPKFLLISCHPIDSYSGICYLGTDELIIFVSFLWMIWVNLPFLIYLPISVVWTSMGVSLAHIFLLFFLCVFILYFAPSLTPPSFFNCFLFFISIHYASRIFPGIFSLIISPNSGFSFFT